MLSIRKRVDELNILIALIPGDVSELKKASTDLEKNSGELIQIIDGLIGKCSLIEHKISKHKAKLISELMKVKFQLKADISYIDDKVNELIAQQKSNFINLNEKIDKLSGQQKVILLILTKKLISYEDNRKVIL